MLPYDRQLFLILVFRDPRAGLGPESRFSQGSQVATGEKSSICAIFAKRPRRSRGPRAMQNKD